MNGTSFDSVEAAVDWIHGKRYRGQKNGLENTRALLRGLGSPESSLRMIHVAGTNGKGSVCAFCERGLREAGYHTGLYTSPYLMRYNERIRVDGVPVSDADLMRLAETVKQACDKLNSEEIYPTAFEIGTAIAFLYFRECRVDYAVIETGIGGRLDATNVIRPILTVITAIGFDHMKLLGNTLPDIAAEKAGIIKEGVTCVASDQAGEILDVFRKKAGSCSSPLLIAPRAAILSSDRYGSTFSSDIPGWGNTVCRISLPGDFQANNASTALTALSLLGIDREKALAGVSGTKWPCRLEWSGKFLIDGSHNPQGITLLKDYVSKYLAGHSIAIVFAMMADKDYASCAKILAGMTDRLYATTVHEQRSASPAELAEASGGKAIQTEDLSEALRLAARSSEIVIATGSLYLAGAVHAILIGQDGAI